MRVQGTQFSFDLGISFLTSPIFRIARNAELQILVVSRPMSVLTQTRIFQWWNNVGNRVPYKLILKVIVIIYLSKLLKHHLLQRDITFSSKIFNSQIFDQNFKYSPVKLKKGALLRYKHVIAFVWRHILGKIAY